MKSAICLSGQPRGFLECYDNLVKNLLEPNDWPDIFIHCWHDEVESGKLYRNDYNFAVPVNLSDSFIKMYNPINTFLEKQREFPGLEQYNSVLQPDDHRFVFSIQSMFYSIMQANNLKILYEKTNDFQYDCVMRLRFDLQIHEPIIFENYPMDVLNLYNDCTHEEGCITDYLAFGSSEIMNIYSNVYNHFDSMYTEGCPFCAEIFLGRLLKEHGVSLNNVDLNYRREGNSWRMV